MAIIQCPECRKGISDVAYSCPHCGYSPPAMPARRGTNPWMVIGWIVLIIILLPLATCALMLGSVSKGGYDDYKQRTSDGGGGAVSAELIGNRDELVSKYKAAKAGGRTQDAAKFNAALDKYHPGWWMGSDMDEMKR